MQLPTFNTFSQNTNKAKMQIGDTVLILPSYSLTEMRLGGLAGMKAKVVEIIRNKEQIVGCWVEFPVNYLGEREWFIPYNSIGI